LEQATDMGLVDSALKQAAGLHHLVAGVVQGGGGVITAVNERHLVALRRHAREDLTDLDPGNVGLNRLVRAANFGRGSRLHVPRIEMAWTAEQKEHDAVHILSQIYRALRLEAEKLRQGQTERVQSARAQKIPPA